MVPDLLTATGAIRSICHAVVESLEDVIPLLTRTAAGQQPQSISDDIP
ncbi:MAG: hypothetical protein JWR10_39 [Rubritepida sp.]|nr:hypothetical protein [Rubritepida sp.]